MVLPQRLTAEESFPFVPPVLAAAAAAYQRARVAEGAQLALMAQQELDAAWSEDVRATVLLARERIHDAQQSRAELRNRVRQFVRRLREIGEPSSAVTDHSRSMIRLLESTGVITPGDGRLEAEVLAWATEDGESR
jgi:hypothetical protein